MYKVWSVVARIMNEMNMFRHSTYNLQKCGVGIAGTFANLASGNVR